MQALVPIAPSLKAPILAASDGDLVRTLPNVYGFSPRYSVMPLFEAQFLIKNLTSRNWRTSIRTMPRAGRHCRPCQPT
jgi:hypothetical protein